MCGSLSDLLRASQRIEMWRENRPHHRGKYSREGPDLLKTADPLSLSFQSKGLKTDKLPAHVFEIDEDAKDEVSRGASSAIISQALITAVMMSGLPFVDRPHHAYMHSF